MSTPAGALTDYTDAQLKDGTTLRFKGQLAPEQVRVKVHEFRTRAGQKAVQEAGVNRGETEIERAGAPLPSEDTGVWPAVKRFGKGLVTPLLEANKRPEQPDLAQRVGRFAPALEMPTRLASQAATGIVEGVKTGARKTATEFKRIAAEAPTKKSVPFGELGLLGAQSLETLPVLGPMGASLGERAGKGDISGAATELGLIAASMSPKNLLLPAARATASGSQAIARTTTQGVQRLGERTGLRIPDAPKALRQAIQPGVNIPRAGESIDIAGPRLQQIRQAGRVVGDTGTPILEFKSPQDLLHGIKAAKRTVHVAIEERLGRVADLAPDTTPVAQAMESTIAGRTARQFPHAAARIRERAATYRGNLSLREIEESIQAANNELRNLYKRPGVTDSPISADIAATQAEVRVLRSLLDEKISKLTGQGVAELKREYGALRDVERATARANAVATRQKGATLWEGLAALHAAGDFVSGNVLGAARGAATLAVGRWLKILRDPNFLVEQAFQGKRAFTSAAPIPPTLGPQVKGLLPPGPIQLGMSQEPLTPLSAAPPILERIPPGPTRPPSGAGRLDVTGLQDPRLATIVRNQPTPTPGPGGRLLGPAPEQRLLGKPPIELGPVPPEPGGVSQAAFRIVRDPKTGKMKRQYLTSPKE